MKNLLIVAVTVFVLAAPMTSRAETGHAKSFVGLWEAVDAEDGAHQILSISANDDGTVKLLGHSTYLTTCDGGRGLAQGTGEVAGERSLQSDDFRIVCFDTGQTEPRPLTLIRHSDGTLREAPPGTGAQLLIYHRTSK